MYEYLEDILTEAPLDLNGEDVTPAISELFQVNETHQKLEIVMADLFYRIAHRFICVVKRTRPDLQVGVVFLCKQLKCLSTGEWKKLTRLVRYTRATIHLSLIIGSDGTGNMG